MQNVPKFLGINHKPVFDKADDKLQENLQSIKDDYSDEVSKRSNSELNFQWQSNNEGNFNESNTILNVILSSTGKIISSIWWLLLTTGCSGHNDKRTYLL